MTWEITAPAEIWLSRFPTDPPSTAATRMWNDSPEMLLAPSPVPQPRGPVSAARWPPQRSIASVDVDAKSKVTVRSVSVAPLPVL